MSRLKNQCAGSIFGALLLGFVSCCGHQAQAASVVSQWFLGENNKISDNSGEYLFNRVLGPGGSTSTLEVGDVLITGFNVETVEDTSGGGGTRNFGAAGVNYFSGFAAIEVTSISPGAVTAFTFGPLSAAAKADLLAGIPGIGTSPSPLAGAEVASWAPGTIIALYDDPANNFVRVPTPPPGDDGAPDIGTGPFVSEETLLAAAINGTRILEVGFDGNPLTIDFWSATTPAALVDVAILATLPTSSNVGAVNFALNLTAPPSGAAAGISFGMLPAFDPVTSAIGSAQFPGNGNIQGVLDANTPFNIFDDLNANFAPQAVPEPSTFGLAALGVCALGAVAWRNRRRKSIG